MFLFVSFFSVVPSRVSNVSVLAVSSTSLNITWIKGKGNYTYCSVNCTCKSPDDGEPIRTSNTTVHASILKNNLKPGTTCTVSVTPHAGIQTGEPELALTTESTYEMGKRCELYVYFTKLQYLIIFFKHERTVR